jgi:hypothetical protein
VLTVNTEEVLAPVDRHVLGGFNFARSEVVDFPEAYRAIAPAEVRIPGGDFGDWADLSDRALAGYEANLVLLGRPMAVVQTRVGAREFLGGPPPGGAAHNQPADAADAVRWVKARGLQVRFWEIGNEPDLYPEKQGDTGMTPERYCDIFRAQAAAMREADPSVVLAGPAVSGVKPGRDRFLERFVKACGDVVDVLTWHVYPGDGTLSDEAALDSVAEVDRSVDGFSKQWADPVANPKGWQRKVEVAITEYGLSLVYNRARQLSDMPAAQWAMEAALRMNVLRVRSAHYYALQGNGYHGLLDMGGSRRPTWYAFAYLAELSGNLVPAQTGDAALWARAARDATRLDVLLTNTTPDQKYLPIAVRGWRLVSADFVDEGVVGEEGPPAALALGATVRLPARSIAHLVFAKE